jgi:prepilin peptidase CpaA
MDYTLSTYLFVILIVSAVIDLRTGKIPNWITYPGMLIPLIYHALFNGLDGLFFGAAGLGFGIALLILFYLMGGMGAGDVKLLGVVGAVVGPEGVFYAFLITALVGGLYAMAVLILSHQPFRSFVNKQFQSLLMLILTHEYIPDSAEANGQNRPRLCYGLAIALGSGFYIVLSLSGYTISI